MSSPTDMLKRDPVLGKHYTNMHWFPYKKWSSIWCEHFKWIKTMGYVCIAIQLYIPYIISSRSKETAASKWKTRTMNKIPYFRHTVLKMHWIYNLIMASTEDIWLPCKDHA